jgi:hypothetical protein
MKIADIQQIPLTVIKPDFSFQVLTFGTMSIAAGIVGNIQMAAMVTLVNMTAEISGTTIFNIPQRFNQMRR